MASGGRDRVRNALASVTSFARRQVSAAAFSALAHVAILMALCALLRPLFFRLVAEEHYRAKSIFRAQLDSDLDVIAQAARSHQPAVPELLVFVVPLVITFVSKRRLRWTDWEHGKALRIFAFGIVLMLAWSGSTSPFNVYLDRAHALDRLIIVASTLLSWRYPVFIPIAVRSALVMLKESYVPIPLDDFDFRAPAEVAVVFSIFVWGSISRSFKPAHFLVVALGCWASYYYAAGQAKWHQGSPHSWLLENHVSNISVAGFVRGWASWIPEHTFLSIAAMARKLDRPLQAYTLLIELGSLVAYFVSRRLTRWWFLGCFVLNFGIFALTGICFWKWMTVSLGAFLWMGRSGKPIVARMHEYKLPLLLAVASIFYGDRRIWYYPQTHVVWYDTRLTENYELYAVGESGKRYLVQPTFFEPSDMHWTQGRLCYDTDDGRSLTGIYATTGSEGLMKQLELAKTPQAGLEMQARAGSCKGQKQDAQKQKADEYIATFFKNLNRRDRRSRLLGLVGRPRHLWVSPKGELTENGKPLEVFDAQEKVRSVELWLTVAYHHGDALHRTEPRLTHTIEIPK